MSSFEDERLLEADIHDFIEARIGALLGDAARVLGREYMLPFGRVDLLCKDRDGYTVVVEIKKGTADRSAVGQLLSYIGALKDSGKFPAVRGILVAKNADEGCQAALKATDEINFFSYQTTLSFTFEHLEYKYAKPKAGAPNASTAIYEAVTSKRYCIYCKRETMGTTNDFTWKCNNCSNSA